MRRPLLATALALAALASAVLGGCGGSGSVTCSAKVQKDLVLATARDWYLYQDLLPQDLVADAYATPDALLDAVTATARAQGLDRGWSYLMSDAQYDAYFQRAQAAGFGFGLLVRGALPQQRLFVSQVFPGSAAAGAGFARGDEIVAIGKTPATLTPVASASNADGTLGALLAAAVGEQRTFSVIPAGGSVAVQRTLAPTASFDLDPVPAPRVYADGTGYVALRSFITPAEPLLRQAFQALRDAGAKRVVVDLRYNGGGYLHTAQVLSDLLASGRAGQPMFDQQFNTRHAASDVTTSFAAEPSAGAFERVAFVTTHASASASELVPNALDPYLPIAFAGAATYGKPVGQMIFDVGSCGEKLFLVSFSLANAAGNAGYYQGLPDAASRGQLCAAEDDLGHAQGSEDEASTAAALTFVRTGSCPTATAAARALDGSVPTLEPVRPASPTPLQRDLPGLF